MVLAMPRRPRVHGRHANRGWFRVLSLGAMMSIAFLLNPFSPASLESAVAASDRLPDLRMARLADFRIVILDGRTLLRFSSTMTNVGAGAFEVRSTRASTSSPWDVDQLIFDDTGRKHRFDTLATMQYGGDGHGHWHIQGMVDVDLWSPSNRATGEKIGYCFFDTTVVNLSLPGAPLAPVYRETSCAREAELTSRVGISVGWGDRYRWSLPFQWVDITGLPAADYRIRAIVDPQHLFVESSTTDNCTYTRLRIDATALTVGVLGSGWSCSGPTVTIDPSSG
jgi:Lysyl oxidase